MSAAFSSALNLIVSRKKHNAGFCLSFVGSPRLQSILLNELCVRSDHTNSVNGYCAVLDSAEVDLAQHFSACFSFIDEARMAGGGVLVHCFAGRSRRLGS